MIAEQEIRAAVAATTEWPAAARVTCVTNNQCGQPFRRAHARRMRVCVRAVIPFRFFVVRDDGDG